MDTPSMEAAYENVRQRLEDLVETIRGSDSDDPIGSLFHLVKDAEDALGVIAVLEGPDEELDADDIRRLNEEESDDSPEPCEMCEGQGFGADGEGAVACPQCNGTGLQPEHVLPIDDDVSDLDD